MFTSFPVLKHGAYYSLSFDHRNNEKMLLIEISFPAWQQYLSWTPLCRQHPHRHRRPQRLQNCCPGDRTKIEYNYFPR